MRTVTAGSSRSASRSYPGCNPSGSMLPSASSEGRTRTEWRSQHQSFTRHLDFEVSGLPESNSLGVSKEIKAAKIVDLGPRAIQKLGTVNDEREALRPAHCDVEAVRVK